MAESSSPVKKLIIVAIVAGVALLAWMEGRWLLCTMRIGECMTAFPRFPSPQDVLDLKGKILDQAKRVKIPPEEVKVEMRMEQQEIGGGSVGLHQERADRFWYLIVDVRWGRHHSFERKRVENSICDKEAERAVLEKGGVTVKRP